MPPLRPFRPLRPGDRLILPRPSLGSSFPEWEAVSDRLRQVGLHPELFGQEEAGAAPYLAPDRIRARDFSRALSGSFGEGVLSYRAGSGAIRLLGEWVDPSWQSLEEIPLFCGFSDATYLHAALWKRKSLVTFWGPSARELSCEESFALWWEMVSGGVVAGESLPLGECRSVRPGRARGRLLGGNLESLSHLCGTPFMPELSGAILLVEDVDEPLYAVDRALRTLALAGSLESLAGVVVGPFLRIPVRSDDPAGSPEDLVRALVGDVPILYSSLPGHGHPMATWPLGVLAEMDCPDPALGAPPTLRLLESPFRSSCRIPAGSFASPC
ncbi:MAG: S66 peptidase family protein [Leptospirillia bacterium]